jgi:hypothetical protein
VGLGVSARGHAVGHRRPLGLGRAGEVARLLEGVAEEVVRPRVGRVLLHRGTEERHRRLDARLQAVKEICEARDQMGERAGDGGSHSGNNELKKKKKGKQ